MLIATALIAWITRFGRWRAHAGAVLAALLLTVVPSPAVAQTFTWTGVSGNSWNTAANWNPAGIPNSATANVIFAGAGSSTVTISSSVNAASLTFTNGIYTLGTSGAQTLSSLQFITVASSVTVSPTINPTFVASGNLLFTGAGPAALTIANNSAAGLLFGFGAVIGTPGNGGVTFTGVGTTTINGSFAAVAGGNQVVGGLTKAGPGTLTLAGDGSTLFGVVTLAGGTLRLDYSTNNAVKFVGAGFTSTGGVLSVIRPTTTFTTQFLGSTTLAAGHTDVTFSGSASVPGLGFNFGAFTRSAGATFNSANISTAGSQLTTTTGNTNGLLGNGPAYATLGGAWLRSDGSGQLVNVTPTDDIFSPGTNTGVTGGVAAPASFTTNSLSINPGAANPLTLAGTNVLQSGGILVRAGTNATITGGTLTSGVDELIVHQYATGLTINSAIVAANGLTKTGTGPLTLGGDNAGLTGPINVNRGDLRVTTPVAVNAAAAINLNDNRNGATTTLSFDFGDGTSGGVLPAIRLSAESAGTPTTLSTGASGNSRVTLGGPISSAPGAVTPLRIGGASDHSSGINLTAANTFTGTVLLSQGTLGINTNASLGDPANALQLGTDSTTAGGLEFLASGVDVARPVAITLSAARIASNGADVNTISGPLTGGALVKIGTGTLALTGTANTHAGTVIRAGALQVAADASLGAGSVAVDPAGTLSFVGSTSSVRTFNLAGTLSVAAGQTLTVTNTLVSGGVLAGPGTIATVAGASTTFAGTATTTSLNLTQAGTNDLFINVSNGGRFTGTVGSSATLTRMTNTSSGRMTIGGSASVNDFVSNGQLTVSPGASFTNSVSDVTLGGGSRTTVGVVGGAAATVNLGGFNMNVAGGLLVNNGGNFPSGGGVRNGTTVVDYGGLAKGTGFYNAVQTINGGVYSPGNSPGLGQVGTFAINGGGTYQFEINDALGMAGPQLPQTRGWDLTQVFTQIDFTATSLPGNRFNIILKTLLAPSGDNAGIMDNFNPTQSYSWNVFELIAPATLNGTFDPGAFNIVTAQFLNPTIGAFALAHNGNFIALNYSPVPEPACVLLIAAAGALAVRTARRVRRTTQPA